MAEGGSANLIETCETSKMCVRNTTSVLLFFQYKYTYTLACEDKLEGDDEKDLDELTDKKGCTKIVGNNGGCITTFNKKKPGRYVEICCCDGDK